MQDLCSHLPARFVLPSLVAALTPHYPLFHTLTCLYLCHTEHQSVNLSLPLISRTISEHTVWLWEAGSVY
jgi:hypothetical protein